MSLTSKKKWASDGGLGPIGGAAPAASNPAPANDGSVEEFMNRIGASLSQLQSTVADLVDRTAAVPTDVDGAPIIVDAETTEVSRTLVLARRTADATLAEAREEAAALLADAERSREEILGDARARADEEYTAQRELALSESRRWEERKQLLTRQFESLDVELGAASARLTEMQDAVRGALAGNDAIVVPDVEEVPTPAASQPAPPAPAASPYDEPVAAQPVAEQPVVEQPVVDAYAEEAPAMTYAAGPQTDPEFVPPVEHQQFAPEPQPEAAPPLDDPLESVVPPLTDTPFAPAGSAFDRQPPAEEQAPEQAGDDGYYRRGLFGR